MRPTTTYEQALQTSNDHLRAIVARVKETLCHVREGAPLDELPEGTSVLEWAAQKIDQALKNIEPFSCACCRSIIDGPVQCAACVNLDERKIQELRIDRDEWKRQHENALACWRHDVSAIMFRYEALSKAAREVVMCGHHDPESPDSRLEALLKAKEV